MTSKTRLAGLAFVACAAVPVPAYAQSTAAQPPADTRPSTTAAHGDTGLWFVPTAEVLPHRNWSFSGYRVNFDDEQGFTDVSRWPVTIGVGLGSRAELFGALTAVTRIDRDLRPLFLSSARRTGGVVNEHPFVRDAWSGNRIGDLWLGAKLNLMSQHRGHPAAFALRGMLKLPTGDDEDGAGTGRMDLAVDAVASTDVKARAELSAFAGMIVRGDPDEWDLLNGIRWGVGLALPTGKALRLTAELHGERYLDDAVRFRGVLPAVIEGVPPIASEQTGPANATIALTWQGRNGLFAGAGVTYNLRMDGRADAGYQNEAGDALGFQLRLGYHRGVRGHAPPAALRPSGAPPAAGNRPPSVRARCEPCTVEAGKTSTVFADASDPDGEVLIYSWRAAAGTLSSPADRESVWTAPMQEGPVPVTIEVTDSRGGRATDAVTFTVLRPVVKDRER